MCVCVGVGWGRGGGKVEGILRCLVSFLSKYSLSPAEKSS